MLSNNANGNVTFEIVLVLRKFWRIVGGSNVRIGCIFRLAAHFHWKVLAELIFVVGEFSMLSVVAAFFNCNVFMDFVSVESSTLIVLPVRVCVLICDLFLCGFQLCCLESRLHPCNHTATPDMVSF